MIGSELAGDPEYLLARAENELSVTPRLGGLARRMAPLFISVFGVPEIGVQMRARHALHHVPKDATSVADIGCGAGMLLGALHQRFPKAMLAGIDVDESSARLAQRLHPYAKVLVADAARASIEFVGRFDCAICIDVLEHVPDAELPKFVTGCARVLRPGGTLIVHVPATPQRRHLSSFKNWSHHDHEREGFTRAELIRLLPAPDFDDLRVMPTFGYLGSLAWEVNMLVAAKPVQALLFPLLMALTVVAEKAASKRNNGWLCVARRTASATSDA